MKAVNVENCCPSCTARAIFRVGTVPTKLADELPEEWLGCRLLFCRLCGYVAPAPCFDTVESNDRWRACFEYAVNAADAETHKARMAAALRRRTAELVAEADELASLARLRVLHEQPGVEVAVHALTKERLAHRLAVECRALAEADGIPAVAFLISEGEGGWQMRAFEDWQAAEGVQAAHRRAGHYTNLYDAGEVDAFATADYGEGFETEPERVMPAADDVEPFDLVVSVTVNDAEAFEWALGNHELQEVPEDTAATIAAELIGHLNHLHRDAVVCVRLQSAAAGGPRGWIRFINGDRGWEAQDVLRSWLLSSWNLFSETEAEYGPMRRH